MGTEGSLPEAPEPSSVSKANLVDKEKGQNMYFSAVAFIFEVKKGPFWEHSPMLFDISGIKDGWGKINKGMVKMYNAEVLSKFPVVQHFPFGSLFRWEQDPSAPMPATSAHMGSQPRPSTSSSTKNMSFAQPSTRAPWSGTAAKTSSTPVTGAPWAVTGSSSSPANVTRAPWS